MSLGKPLNGKRIVVVEDEELTKLAVEDALRTAGATIAKSHMERVDAAVLDLRLRYGVTAVPIAIALHQRGVPFVFYTGCTPEEQAALREQFGACTILQKPASGAALVDAVSRALQPDALPPSAALKHDSTWRRLSRRF
jgi:DNA-binding NtrC family response regulator